jgi:hypothetical protein
LEFIANGGNQIEGRQFISMELITESLTEPWGTYKPNWRQKMISIVVKIGFSHGSIKKLMRSFWYLNEVPQYPVDIIYQGVKFRLHPWDNVKDSKLVFGSAVQDAMELNFLKKWLSKDSVFSILERILDIIPAYSPQAVLGISSL